MLMMYVIPGVTSSETTWASVGVGPSLVAAYCTMPSLAVLTINSTTSTAVKEEGAEGEKPSKGHVMGKT